MKQFSVLMLLGWVLWGYGPALAQKKKSAEGKEGKPSAEADSAQSRRWQVMADFHYVLGGETNNYYFNLRRGFGLRTGLLAKVAKRTWVGPQLGLTQLDGEETLIPLGLAVRGRTKGQDQHWVYGIQGGWGWARSQKWAGLQGYSQQGGPQFSAEVGYRLPLNERMGWSLGFRYAHHSAVLRYQGEGLDFQERIAYETLGVVLGLDW